MVEILILILINTLYCMLEGLREAWYDHEVINLHINSKTPDNREEHRHYFIQRCCFYGAILLYMIDFSEGIFFIPFTVDLSWIAIVVQFSFIHNASYMIERNRLAKINKLSKPYPKGFFAHGTREYDDKLEIELKFITRGILFLLGVILLIIKFIIL